ncbi:hypothetical protein AK830_g12543 [Neonectria ditissima]|uniref:Uncharacterized protein n=1 Tax=Neonectria ditissima TaxID=78410 RepID=A0A0P7B0A3_9HYPO|nr:hypothetical protein AK830_g12543 [Neonectria ditissima]
MHRARETEVARAPKDEWRDLHVTAPPIAIGSYNHGTGNELVIRDAENTCGFYTWSETGNYFPFLCPAKTPEEHWLTTSGSSESWEPLDCGTVTCGTIDTHFACGPTAFTTCYESTHESCTTGASAPPRELCCLDGNYPACVTAIKDNDDDDNLTGYMCGVAAISGEVSVFDTPVANRTSTITKSGVTSRVDVKTTLSTYATGSGSGKNAIQTKDGDSDDGGSSTPVGAIVGGVVGGLALIVFLGFGFWFIRFQKNKAAAQAERDAAQTAQMSQPPAQYQGSPQTQLSGYQPVAQGTPSVGGEYQFYQDGTVVPQTSPMAQGTPFMGGEHQFYQDGTLVPQAFVPKPETSPQPPAELPSERHRDSTPVELQ